jgi:hypothetical protein
LFAFVVLSGATYYGVATSETRSELRRLDYLGRQILRSAQEGTPLHERALSEADRRLLAGRGEELAGRIRLVRKERAPDDWRLGYCFGSGTYAELRFTTPTEQPGLFVEGASDRCLE